MTEKMMAFGGLGAPQRIGYSITGSTGTPLPADVRPAPVFETGTGALAPAVGPAEVVRSAGTVVHGLAMLAVTDEGNALMDELLSSNLEGQHVRPLKRRLEG